MSDKKPKSTKRNRRIPSSEIGSCTRTNPVNTLGFLLNIDTDEWGIADVYCGIENDVKVTHFRLEFRGEPGACPKCGGPLKVHDRRHRSWRHANLDDTVCYIHADVPRCRCDGCRTLAQVSVPWADPNVSYTKRFEEVAIELMSNMSLRAAARELIASWRVLDDIVGRSVDRYLDNLDLSKVRRIRIDETSAKKHHRYITVVTDADTDRIIFITKGKDSSVVGKFADWLLAHNGDPANIMLVASDFGDAFLSGTRKYLPNAESVLDPFHLVQIANRHLDHDRASCQSNGNRMKAIRYAMLKKPKNLKPEEEAALADFTRDNEDAGRSYEMKESLRQLFAYSAGEVELAREHLDQWIRWAAEKGSKGFKGLAETLRGCADAVIRTIETGLNNGFQESLNGRIQLSKAIGRGYKQEMRLARIAIFRDIYREL